MRIEFFDNKNNKKVEVELFNQPKGGLKLEAVGKLKFELFNNRKYQGKWRGEKTNCLPLFKIYNKDFLGIRNLIVGFFGFCFFVAIWPRHKEEKFCCAKS